MIACFSLASSLAGCSLITYWKDDGSAQTGSAASSSPANFQNEKKNELSPQNVTSESNEELELKITKLSARLSELEGNLLRQRERMKLVERGLMLGILPEELKAERDWELDPVGSSGHEKGKRKNSSKSSAKSAEKSNAKTSKNSKKAKSQDEASGPELSDIKEDEYVEDQLADLPETGKANPTPDDLAKSLPTGDTKLSSAELEEYQKRFTLAHDNYRAGRYGRAIVDFTSIGKDYGAKIENAPYKFWIARSWVGLKEFQTARDLLAEYVRDFPSSPWAPRANLELSRAEFQLGFKEKAVKRLRDLIQAYPNEDATEMAKMELQNMQKAL